jgi:hypothetical protein
MAAIDRLADSLAYLGQPVLLTLRRLGRHVHRAERLALIIDHSAFDGRAADIDPDKKQ